MTAMIKLRHQQPSLWHRGLAEDIEGLWEPVDCGWWTSCWKTSNFLDTVYEAQGERHPQSRSVAGCKRRGSRATLLLLKHIRNWSYDVCWKREVRANLVYRAFTRIGDEKVPDAKTLARLGQLIGPAVIEQLHRRVVELAQERGVTQGKKVTGGYDGGGKQHSIIRPTAVLLGERDAGADAHDEEDPSRSREV